MNLANPEPILITNDSGMFELATDAFPLTTIINIDAMASMPGFAFAFDFAGGMLYVTLGNKKATYRRVAYTLNKEWVCDLEIPSLGKRHEEEDDGPST